jgi:regulation of enolase protein 1 (concanavalin A-like superfamily)
VKARIESFGPSVHLYTKAGLMARESLAGNSRHVFAAAFTDNQQRADNVSGYEFNVRPVTGGSGFALSPSFPQPLVNYPNTWIRLKRAGDLFICYASQDGVSWRRFATYSLALPQTVYFGMAATSHSTSQTTTARFRDFANNREHISLAPYAGSGPVHLFIGGEAGARYFMQYSANFSNWITYGLVVNATNEITEVTNTPPAGTPVRFYRALLVP